MTARAQNMSSSAHLIPMSVLSLSFTRLFFARGARAVVRAKKANAHSAGFAIGHPRSRSALAFSLQPAKHNDTVMLMSLALSHSLTMFSSGRRNRARTRPGLKETSPSESQAVSVSTGYHRRHLADQSRARAPASCANRALLGGTSVASPARHTAPILTCSEPRTSPAARSVGSAGQHRPRRRSEQL